MHPTQACVWRRLAQRGFLHSKAKMHVQAIPMDWNVGDNYAYLIKDDASTEGTVIDPAQAHEVMPVLQRLIDQNELKLISITNTHHHFDHSGGNLAFHTKYPQLPIVGGKNSPLVTYTPQDGEKYKIGQSIEVTAIHTPCHTQDSICYHAVDVKTGDSAVFTGDTLFNAGSGRFFEGNAEEMYNAMAKLAKLPPKTKVYTGHEYTKSNAAFAVQVMPLPAIQKLVDYCDTHEHTAGVFTIGDELEHNLFMRTDDPELQKVLKVSNAVDAMAELRRLKNNF